MYRFLSAGRAVERVVRQGQDTALISAGDGTEVIRYRLDAGNQLILFPEAGWDALEFIYVLNGHLRCQVQDGEMSLLPGDSLSFCPVSSHVMFTAIAEASFLYVSSRPVFHNYSKQLSEFRELAVSVEEKDGYTRDHCERIKRLAMMVGEQMGLSAKALVHLNHGAFLHDVGKVKVPDLILNKPAALSPDEWMIMKQHPTDGQEILLATGHPLLCVAAAIVAQHHERWDGTGYPMGLKENEILLEAAIVSVVDSYDAMTSSRPYRKGLSHEESIDEVRRGRGTQFRPDVVDSFLKIQLHDERG